MVLYNNYDLSAGEYQNQYFMLNTRWAISRGTQLSITETYRNRISTHKLRIDSRFLDDRGRVILILFSLIGNGHPGNVAHLYEKYTGKIIFESVMIFRSFFGGQLLNSFRKYTKSLALSKVVALRY